MNASDPIVSVIMPCYNQGQYLDEAIDSVRSQTYQNVEVIVINDGSTDALTIDILCNYQQPGVSIIHTANRGPAAARNTGIEQARGVYILPLDADDRIAPTYLEQAVKCLDADPGVGIVYCEAEFFGEKTGRFELPAFNFPGILLGNMIFNSSVYRKVDWEKVGGYKDHFHGWEDYDFWLSLLELGRDVVKLPDVLYFYRQVASSRSNSMTRQNWIEDYTRLFQNHSDLYGPNMRVVFEHIVDLRDDVHRTHTRLGQTLDELVQTHARLERVQTELATLQNSKFGRLYNQYIKLKQRFRHKTEQLSR